jgi:hypothetical protein
MVIYIIYTSGISSGPQCNTNKQIIYAVIVIAWMVLQTGYQANVLATIDTVIFLFSSDSLTFFRQGLCMHRHAGIKDTRAPLTCTSILTDNVFQYWRTPGGGPRSMSATPACLNADHAISDNIFRLFFH